ncbi:hypothetical protein [Nonomuraea typhae]|uniref:hypothetical protein n=1 Tax=Nonomuraea typhae TaxID=2603600 RepID=UPI0012F896E1|nr:hypothetical protein [Nonomuraea typhae]
MIPPDVGPKRIVRRFGEGGHVFSEKQVSLSYGPRTITYRVAGGGSASVSLTMCATA